MLSAAAKAKPTASNIKTHRIARSIGLARFVPMAFLLSRLTSLLRHGAAKELNLKQRPNRAVAWSSLVREVVRWTSEAFECTPSVVDQKLAITPVFHGNRQLLPSMCDAGADDDPIASAFASAKFIFASQPAVQQLCDNGRRYAIH